MPKKPSPKPRKGKPKTRKSGKSAPISRKKQVAALCWREAKDGGREILLITSRDTGRWIIPKGWPMSKKAPHETAQIEAWEEAGAKGNISRKAIGSFTYNKVMHNADDIPCRVTVFPLKVQTMDADFPEKKERKLEWVNVEEASRRVNERGLKRLFKSFEKIRKL